MTRTIDELVTLDTYTVHQCTPNTIDGGVVGYLIKVVGIPGTILCPVRVEVGQRVTVRQYPGDVLQCGRHPGHDPLSCACRVRHALPV